MNNDQEKDHDSQDLVMEGFDVDFWIAVISILGCVFIIGFAVGATLGALS